MNKCIFQGRLTKDPDISYVQTAKGNMATAKFSLAVDKKMSAQKKQEATAAGNSTCDFINCKAIGNTAELIQQYFHKGDGIIITSTFDTYSYNDQQTGQKRYGYNFVVSDFDFPMGKSNNAGQQPQQQAPQDQGGGWTANRPPMNQPQQPQPQPNPMPMQQGFNMFDSAPPAQQPMQQPMHQQPQQMQQPPQQPQQPNGNYIAPPPNVSAF